LYTLLCLPLIYIVYEGSFTQSTTFFTFFYFFLSLQELLLQAMFRTIVFSLPPGCQPTTSAPGAAAQNNCYESSAARRDSPNPNKSFLRENKTPNNSSTPNSQPRTRTKKPADSAASLKARTIYPEQALPRANPRPSPTPQGVFWALFVFFVIFCYIYHII